MAYGLKYYKELKQPNGTVVRLEIHQKVKGSLQPVEMEIGDVVQGLFLQFQGQQGDVDTPIVKTSLSMTFVDAPDLVQANDAYINFKTGNWEEFYTADSTKWKVIVKENGSTIWGGYITPDSYSEDLVYHGSVNIIARDNIGHLQDFPFDDEGYGDGTTDLQRILTKAWEKIESPMDLDLFGDANSVQWPECEGVPLYLARMNVSFFEDMDYYKAVEKALYSLGCVMRYTERNRVHVCPLKDMPKHGYFSYDHFGMIEPTFVSGARRELVPAVKIVEEVTEYELEDTVQMPQVKTSDFTGEQTTYRCKVDGEMWSRVEHDAPVWPIQQFTQGWGNNAFTTLFFDISRYETGYFTERRREGDSMRKHMYIACNNVEERQVRFDRKVSLSDFSVYMKLGQTIVIDSSGKVEIQSIYTLKKITYAIAVTAGGTQYYYNGGGEWGTTEKKLTKDYDIVSPATEFKEQVFLNDDLVGVMTGYETLSFILYKIEYAQVGYSIRNAVGLYASVQEFSFGVPDTVSLMEKNTIKTVYNEGNNVVLKRSPELGPAYDPVLFPGLIKNGIFKPENNALRPAKEWSFGSEEPAQLGVLIHKQLLCYHSKPNNYITGNIVNGMLGLSCNWIWHEKEHILISGSLNLLTGQIQNAVLREFIRYEDMWKNETPEGGGGAIEKPDIPIIPMT